MSQPPSKPLVLLQTPTCIHGTFAISNETKVALDVDVTNGGLAHPSSPFVVLPYCVSKNIPNVAQVTVNKRFHVSATMRIGSRKSTIVSIPVDANGDFTLRLEAHLRHDKNYHIQLSVRDELDQLPFDMTTNQDGKGEPFICEIPPEDILLNHSERIGAGAFGSVHRGRWIRLNGDVALKRLRHMNSRTAFLRDQLPIMRRLRSPHVVQLFGYCVEPDAITLVMELCQSSLDYVLMKDTLTWARKKSLAIQAVKAVNFLHNLSPPIIHRDIKPSNFLVHENGDLKLADFDLAVNYDSTSPNSSEFPGGFAGTLAYMAPEFLLVNSGPHLRQNQSADIYSLGMVLWTICAGEIPYRGLSTSEFRKLKSNGRLEAFRACTREDEAIPADWMAVIHQCLDLSPMNRPLSSLLLQRVMELSIPTGSATAIEHVPSTTFGSTPINDNFQSFAVASLSDLHRLWFSLESPPSLNNDIAQVNLKQPLDALSASKWGASLTVDENPQTYMAEEHAASDNEVDPDEIYYNRIPKDEFQQLLLEQQAWFDSTPNEDSSDKDICLFIAKEFSPSNLDSQTVSATLSSEEIRTLHNKSIAVICSGDTEIVQRYFKRYPWFHRLFFISGGVSTFSNFARKIVVSSTPKCDGENLVVQVSAGFTLLSGTNHFITTLFHGSFNERIVSAEDRRLGKPPNLHFFAADNDAWAKINGDLFMDDCNEKWDLSILSDQDKRIHEEKHSSVTYVENEPQILFFIPKYSSKWLIAKYKLLSDSVRIITPKGVAIGMLVQVADARVDNNAVKDHYIIQLSGDSLPVEPGDSGCPVIATIQSRGTPVAVCIGLVRGGDVLTRKVIVVPLSHEAEAAQAKGYYNTYDLCTCTLSLSRPPIANKKTLLQRLGSKAESALDSMKSFVEKKMDLDLDEARIQKNMGIIQAASSFQTTPFKNFSD